MDLKELNGLDIFWLRDESLEESDNLPDPDIPAQRIVEDVKAARDKSAKSPRTSLHRKVWFRKNSWALTSTTVTQGEA